VIPSLVPLTTRFRRRLAAAVAVAVTAFLPLAAPATPNALAADGSARAAAASGYWMVASDGGIFSFGDAKFFGSTGNIKLNQPIVGIAATPSGNGYWMVATDGGIFSFGDAKFFGSTGAIKLNKPIVGMASTPSGKGYWLVASDGGIFAFGDAKFFGSTGDIKLNKPIVGMASSPTGNGYWFVASDGGIFAFGDAKFYGSTGAIKLAKPITAMATTPSGKGYWFTASDGGIFAFGDAKFYGAGPERPNPNRNVTAMVPAGDGAGYWLGSATGELLAFGSAGNFGGLPSAPAKPIVGMTAVPANAIIGTPVTPGGPGPTTNPSTGPTTSTTAPPYTGPMRFSSTALHSWGTPPDTEHSRVNSGGATVYPYAQKVDAIEEIGNRVYIGGEFQDLHQNNDPKSPTMSGIPMDYLAELDTDGNAVPGSAFNARVTLNDSVRALLRSPDGKRLYVAGEFSSVNGQPRPYIVALDPATGEVDSSFNPPKPNAYVSALALLGDKLYIGGAFTSLGTDPSRPGLAALNLDGTIDGGFTPPTRYLGKFIGHTGIPCDDPLGTDPNVPDAKCTKPGTVISDPMGTVEAIEPTTDGKYLVVGGSFLHWGMPYDPALCTGTCVPGEKSDTKNHNHGGLITLDPVTGALTTWQPENNRPVFDLASYQGDPHSQGINASTLVFAATGGAGGRVVAWVPGGSKDTPLWRGNMDGDAMSVAVTQDRVYVVGHFDHTVADPGDKCLEIDPATGGVHCDGGTPSRHFAAFDVRGDPNHKGWSTIDTTFTAQANTSEGPYRMLLGANRMYVGGNFTEVAPMPVGSCGCGVKQPGFAVLPPLQ
jgi:ribosomal protein L24E